MASENTSTGTHQARSTPTRVGLAPQIFPDHERQCLAATAWLVERLQRKPQSIFCVASGGSTARTFELLAQRQIASPSLLAETWIFKMDEWGGMPMNDPGTNDSYFRQRLTGPTNLHHRLCGFDSNPPNPEAECLRVRDWLKSEGPVDICLLGMGLNGHLGFNEPADKLQPFSHVARLSDTSQNHPLLVNALTRPTYGLTIGMAEILQSREILLLVNGSHKREPLRRLLEGKVSTSFPASFLWLHPNVTLLCDHEAIA